MFRTGHRTDPTAWVEPAPEPVATPEAVVEVAPRTEAPTSAAPHKVPVAETTIGQGVTFDGTLRFAGTMRMSGGTFNGKITEGERLIVGDGATLSADASCGSIEVHGEARGTLTARDSVDLRSPARVTADVSAPSFTIEKGALFDGNVRMSGAKVARTPKRVATPE